MIVPISISLNTMNIAWKNIWEDGIMEKILKGGATLAVQISENRILHYFVDEITITDNKMKTIEIFKRVGGFYE